MKNFTKFTTFLENKKMIGKTVKIVAQMSELGSNYPFATGDVVKIVDFVGYQGDEPEYRIKANKKTATILGSMVEVI